MSAGILGAFTGLLGEPTFALITGPSTSIGGIIPDVLISEVPRDEMVITDHPVDGGTAITDHTFIRPTVVEMRIGFSNSSAGQQGYVQQVYEDLLRLQRVREPFDVFTARRRYRNMLVASITAPRDERTNSVLDVLVVLRQVVFTHTKQTGAAASDQSMPQTTGSVSDTGTRQLEPATPGSDGFGSTFSPGSNLDFAGAPPGAGLAPSGADASLGDMVFEDGSVWQGGPATGQQGVAPGSLQGNPGMFGSYGPNAFRGSYAKGAFGK